MLTIDWIPTKKDTVPLYRQITSYIKTKILSGQWPIGSKLPPQRELSALFAVNRSTLCSALDELSASGFIESKRGSSTFVSNNTWAKFSQPAVDWNPYLDTASDLSNIPLIQKINQLEFSPDIIRLGTGELSPSLLPNKQLQSIIAQAGQKITSFGYQEPLGLLELREQISIQLKKTGIEASPASILIVSGALQALQLIFFGLLSPYSRILLERPSYLRSLKMFSSRQLQFSEVPMDASGPSLSAIRHQQEKKPHALFYTIPTFHNPTGTLVSDARRHSLISLCQKLHLPILEDNVYHDLWLDEPPPPPLKALDTQGSVLHIDSLSKSVGPGLRIGWIVGPEPIIEKLGDLKMQHDYGSSVISQWIAYEWLQHGLHEKHMAQLRQKLKQRRTIMLRFLERHFRDLAHWQIPAGGFYIWLHLNKAISQQQLFAKALQKKILLNPGSIYDNLSNTNLRLSYAFASPDEIEKSLYELSLILKSFT